MGTIVVGVDGSDESRTALHWSLEEGQLRGAVVKALHVWQYPPDLVWQFPPSTFAAEVAPTPDRELFEQRANNLLRGVVSQVAGASAEVKQEVVEGLPADRLVAAARGGELLVVGSRGRGGFRGLLLGSVSQQCAHHAVCPTVIVPPSSEGRP
jgi:nucleotide-binding universal stress UspA family protein